MGFLDFQTPQRKHLKAGQIVGYAKSTIVALRVKRLWPIWQIRRRPALLQSAWHPPENPVASGTIVAIGTTQLDGAAVHGAQHRDALASRIARDR